MFVEGLASPTNTDDMDTHIGSALSIARDKISFIEDLKTPLLVPVIPHTADNHDDYQGLGRGALVSTRENLVRVDLQLIAMIADARKRLADMGIQTQKKVFMDGFSISGYFTSRFTILHPDIVQAAAVGAPGGWPLAPLAKWEGYTMNYPVGIADTDTLIDFTFNKTLYTSIPQFYYMGDADEGDAIGRFTPEEQVFLMGLGATPFERWPEAQVMHDAIGCNAYFTSYPGVEHTITEEMQADILQFFKDNMPSFFSWSSFVPAVITAREKEK